MRQVQYGDERQTQQRGEKKLATVMVIGLKKGTNQSNYKN